MNKIHTKVKCGVCNGKGGFRKLKNDAFDTNWIVCPYCDGYGFVENEVKKENTYIQYETYKSKIMSEIKSIADVKVFTSEILGKDIYIKAIPIKRNKWVELIKTLLKFSHYSENVSVIPKQVFYHTDTDHNHSYWEVTILTNSLEDLDGIVDVIRMHNGIYLR